MLETLWDYFDSEYDDNSYYYLDDARGYFDSDDDDTDNDDFTDNEYDTDNEDTWYIRRQN
jgi:hypothetical protein